MKFFAMAALLAVGACHAQNASSVQHPGASTGWKLATGYRAESFHTQNILQFSRDVEQATAGQLLIQVHPNNTLAKLNDISQAVQQGKAESGETIMSSLVKDIAIAGADSVPFKINAWFPKNVVFVSSKAFEALRPEVRGTVLKAATDAEVRGWLASQALAMSATQELRKNGIRIERIPADMEQEIKRMGEKFSREWVRSVGNEANNIFVPYYLVQ